MRKIPLENEDHFLIKTAHDTIEKAFHPIRHLIGAALLCTNGTVFTGVNVKACSMRPCAETIALGSAITKCESSFKTIVAVQYNGSQSFVTAPCGNCRQLLADYASTIHVILQDGNTYYKTPIEDLIPLPYQSSFTKSLIKSNP